MTPDLKTAAMCDALCINRKTLQLLERLQLKDSWSSIAPLTYLDSISLRSGLGLEVGVRSNLEGKAVLSSNGLGVRVQFCQGFWEGWGPGAGVSLSGVDRWLLWKGSVWVSNSRGTPTIRSCLRSGRRPWVDWLRGLEPSGGFPWPAVGAGVSRGDSSASKPVLS